jgi:peptide/nickel transport system substrate-binding protein
MQKYGYILLVMTLGLTGCFGGPPGSLPVTTTPAEPEAAPTEEVSQRGTGDTLRLLHPETPTTLNPHLARAVKDREASRITFEPLATFDKDGNLVPFLAAEIPTLDNGGVAADGKSVTWKLKQDVQWSDGEPFTADDVLFTYEFVSNAEVGAASAGNYSAIESVEVIDDYTVKLNFKDVNPAWALPFVGVQGAVIPRHIYEPYNGPNVQDSAQVLPVGTGPYRVMPPGIKPQEVLLLGTQLVETNKIDFEPNPFFREPDKPYFSRVEFRGGGTANEAARLSLEDGWVDVAYTLEQLSPEELAQKEQAGQGRLVTNFGARVERVLLNRTDPNEETADGERSSTEFSHPFFSDEKVRQAFAHAIDRETITALFGPVARPTTNNLVAPPQFNSPNTFYEYDLGKAKALLDEAGWVDTDGDGFRDKDGVEMKVDFQTFVGTIPQEIQQIIKAALEELGVEVELKITDSSIMFGPGADNPDSAWRFNADMMQFSVRSASPDPSAYMRYWVCDSVPQKANNWTGNNFERWCSPEYDALLAQSTTEIDPEKRAQLFIQMNDTLIEDVVMIPIAYRADATGVSNTLEGIDLTPWDTNTWNIQDWRRVAE